MPGELLVVVEVLNDKRKIQLQSREEGGVGLAKTAMSLRNVDVCLAAYLGSEIK